MRVISSPVERQTGNHFRDQSLGVGSFSYQSINAFSSGSNTQSLNPTGKNVLPPEGLRLTSDHQSYDFQRDRFVAEGRVRAYLNGGLLRADRIEFDSGFRTLYAIGSVRFSKGSQYFQASTFRYNLIHEEGELEDVYGVLDLASLAKDLKQVSLSGSKKSLMNESLDHNEKNSFEEFFFNLDDKNSKEPNSQKKPEKISQIGTMACPPPLPPIPNWHPHPWALTAWGGQMTNANFGKTFFFKGNLREEYLFGLGLSRRIYKAGPFEIELEADLFKHNAFKQDGGEYNQSVAFSDTPSQDFEEGIFGIGARLWLRPWLSFGVIEGISVLSSSSNYERTFREKYANLLNYLSFEIEASFSRNLSLVGRIHHRSGAFGVFNGAKEGSNAYLLGLRYRWGEDKQEKTQVAAVPPLGCPESGFYEKKNSKVSGDSFQAIPKGFDLYQSASEKRSLMIKRAKENLEISKSFLVKGKSFQKILQSQENLRAKRITELDQRIDEIKLRESLTVQKLIGLSKPMRNINEKNKYGGIQVAELNRQGRAKFITGSITRWRVQATKVTINSNGWEADRMGFSNDPFTPSQTRIEAEDVVAIEQPNGDLLIKSRRNRLILEDRLPIPVSRSQRISKQEEVENRWIYGIDNKDRDGLFVGRELKPIDLFGRFKLSLVPQFLVQRAKNGSTNSYQRPNSSISSNSINQIAKSADLFGIEAEMRGELFNWDLDINADISTFNPKLIAKGSRYWGSLRNSFSIPFAKDIDSRLFGLYRYRAWNGSLGETEIYSGYGSILEKKSRLKFFGADSEYLVRVGLGKYQAKSSDSERILSIWRGNLYGSLSSSYPLYDFKHERLNLIDAYRYSPKAIKPGLSLNTNISTSYSAYNNGSSQATLSISAGPVLTVGTFSKPFFDYTRMSISLGGTLKSGESPFDFDQASDLRTLGFGLTQQIAGPLLVSTGFEWNIDPASEYLGKTINSKLELLWQRRSYDLGLYYSPYEGTGGFRVRLNDFNFNGTGLPFVPYDFNKANHSVEGKGS